MVKCKIVPVLKHYSVKMGET